MRRARQSERGGGARRRGRAVARIGSLRCNQVDPADALSLDVCCHLDALGALARLLRPKEQ